MLLKPRMTGHLGETAIFIHEADKLRQERGRMVHSGLNDIASKVTEGEENRGGKKTFVKQTSYEYLKFSWIEYSV